MTLRAALLIGIASTLAFVGVLGHGFVYDDSWTVIGNRWLDSPILELMQLLFSGRALENKVPDATRPVMVLSLAIDRRLYGGSAAGYHLSSLILYGINCLLATSIAVRVSRKLAIGTTAGAFFALAPLHAEPVAAINYREDLLSGAGVLATWLCLLGSPKTTPPAREDRKRALGVAAAFAFALFAKESGVALLPLVAITLFVEPRERGLLRRRHLFAALCVVILIWGAWRVPLALRGDDIPLAPARSFTETMLRSARFMMLSAGHALFPVSWTPDHWRQPPASPLWLAALLAFGAAVAYLARRRRTRTLALGLALAVVAPLPTSPFFRPVNELADRYFFLGILGGGLVWGVVFSRIGERFGLRGKRGALAALVCLPLLIPARAAATVWRDEHSLWQAAVDRVPASPRAWAALSRVHRSRGDHAAAAAAIHRAVTIDPDYAPALVTRIYNEIAAGRLSEARFHVQEIDQRGLGNYRGMRQARHCIELDTEAARACIER